MRLDLNAISLKSSTRVCYRNFTVFRKTFFLGFPATLFEPLIYFAVFAIFIGTRKEGVEGRAYLKFLTPSIIVLSSVFSTTLESTVCVFMRMSLQKLHLSIISTPVNSEDVAVGEILWATTKGVIFGTISGTVLAIFGFIDSPWALLLPVVIFLGCSLFAIIGITLTSIVRNFDNFQYYFTLVLTPMVFFSGVFFPSENLPKIIKILVWFFPLKHFMVVTRELTLGHISPRLFIEIAWIIVAIFILILLPLKLLKRRLIN